MSLTLEVDLAPVNVSPALACAVFPASAERRERPGRQRKTEAAGGVVAGRRGVSSGGVAANRRGSKRPPSGGNPYDADVDIV
jgi:hypothetical protein